VDRLWEVTDRQPRVSRHHVPINRRKRLLASRASQIHKDHHRRPTRSNSKRYRIVGSQLPQRHAGQSRHIQSRPPNQPHAKSRRAQSDQTRKSQNPNRPPWRRRKRIPPIESVHKSQGAGDDVGRQTPPTLGPKNGQRVDRQPRTHHRTHGRKPKQADGPVPRLAIKCPNRQPQQNQIETNPCQRQGHPKRTSGRTRRNNLATSRLPTGKRRSAQI